MSAAIVFAALLVCIFPFAGLLVGLGPSRFWEALGWVCGHFESLQKEQAKNALLRDQLTKMLEGMR